MACRSGQRRELDRCPNMGTATGRKPPTSGLGNRCSIQLSYGDVTGDIASDAYNVCFFSRSAERARRTSTAPLTVSGTLVRDFVRLFFQSGHRGFEPRSGPPEWRISASVEIHVLKWLQVPSTPVFGLRGHKTFGAFALFAPIFEESHGRARLFRFLRFQ
jgi:hypothetical protein